MLFDYLFKRPTYDLCVTYYYRGRAPSGQPRRFHRAIFLMTDPMASPSRGTIFHLAETRPFFRFSQMSDTEITLSQLPERYSGLVKVGEIRKADVKLVEQILRDVPVVHDASSEWGSQEWTRDGIRRLAKSGFVDLSKLTRLNDNLTKGEAEFLATLPDEPRIGLGLVSYAPSLVTVANSSLTCVG